MADHLCDWSEGYYLFCPSPATEVCPNCLWRFCASHTDSIGLCLFCISLVQEEAPIIFDPSLGVD